MLGLLQGAIDLGVQMETWLVRFDDQGACNSPETARALRRRLDNDVDRPVIFFAHGWNNDFDAAAQRYQAFLAQFEQHVAAHRGDAHPVFVGVLWPSIWLSFDDGPWLAGMPGREVDYVMALASAIDHDAARQRFCTLMAADSLNDAGASELATLVSRVLLAQKRSAEAAVEDGAVPGAGDLLAALKSMPGAARPDDDSDLLPEGGTIDTATTQEPAPAGFLRYLDPRSLVRIASVYQMKDRAGTVGANGVAQLLSHILQSGHPVHLVGHSYGAKVVLSALAHAQATQQARSMLLLQPAVSHLAFANNVPEAGGTGGYHMIPGRVAQSLLMTYSANDHALHDIFHLALRRKVDVAEIGFAAGGAGDPPSRFAALGGYGQRRANERLGGPLPAVGDRPAAVLESGRPVAFDGSNGQIRNHGDVANPFTAWLLYLQVTGQQGQSWKSPISSAAS